MPKKGQLGFVDKAYLTDNGKHRIAKIRIREDRTPAVGDKFCSRCGQKGTIGRLVPEIDMPFTKSGIKPDIIVNPHALPSRMTIGQLIEMLLGKSCITSGYHGDSTAFVNKGPKHVIIGNILNKNNLHSKGEEILYNSMTGEQIETSIFMGPTYYMRLKHMVKDKINYRTTGPRTLLERQTVGGRANDGGLALGEMERDSVISHGMTSFIKDSMMNRGDSYKLAICNQSGNIALYNKEQDMFYSLSIDGPLKYDNDENPSPQLITKFGKSFSIINVPYCFKLLIQELTTMNIHMRIITDDNVDYLEGKGTYNLKDIMSNVSSIDSNESVQSNVTNSTEEGETKAESESDDEPEPEPEDEPEDEPEEESYDEPEDEPVPVPDDEPEKEPVPVPDDEPEKEPETNNSESNGSISSVSSSNTESNNSQTGVAPVININLPPSPPVYTNQMYPYNSLPIPSHTPVPPNIVPPQSSEPFERPTDKSLISIVKKE
jgi:DNA-directed RNA polymerase II subunit RPB2